MVLALLLGSAAIGPVPAAAAPPPGSYVAVTPLRLLDTRNGTGAVKAQIGAGKALQLQVGGKGGVPTTGVASVLLSVNAVNSTASGRVVAYAAGTARPNISGINFPAGKATSALVMSRVSRDGKVSFFNTSRRPIDLIADLSGYYTSGSVTAAGGFVPLSPSRTLDTRIGVGAKRADWTTNAGGGINFGWKVAGRNGVPVSGAKAVVLSVTVANVAATSRIAAFPSGIYDPVYSDTSADDPAFSTLSAMPFDKGVTRTNLFIVPIGSDGRVEVSGPWDPAGTFDVLGDVLGYIRGGVTTVPGMYQPVPAMQMLRRFVPLAGGATMSVKMAGPGLSANVLSVYAIGGRTSGSLVVSQHGTPRPAVRSVNFLAGQQVSNSVVVRSSRDSLIDIYNSSSAPVQVAVDLTGYFRGAAPVANTAWSWGDNRAAQLGAGSSSDGSAIPAPISFTAVREVYAAKGPYGSNRIGYGLRTDGSLWSWGTNSDPTYSNFIGSALGLGDASAAAVPTRVTGVLNVIDVAPYVGGFYALQADGTVWGAGDGQEGQLGALAVDGVRTPAKIPGLTGITAVADRAALRADGTVVTWDLNGVSPVPGLTGIVDLAGGYALSRSGTVTIRNGVDAAVTVPGIGNVTAINEGFALRSDGTVWALPVAAGQPGRQVAGLTSVTKLGTSGSVAVRTDGSLWTWSATTAPVKAANLPAVRTAAQGCWIDCSATSIVVVAR